MKLLLVSKLVWEMEESEVRLREKDKSKKEEEKIPWTEIDVKYITRLSDASKAEVKQIKVSSILC